MPAVGVRVIIKNEMNLTEAKINPIPTQIRGHVYYLQNDPRWAALSYPAPGDSYRTIGQDGCMPTLQAIVIQNLSGTSINPLELAQWNIIRGYRKPTYTTREGWEALGEKYGFECHTSDLRDGHGQFDKQEVAAYIREACARFPYVMVGQHDDSRHAFGTPSGHIIAITDLTGDEVRVLDTNSVERSQKTWSFSRDIVPYLIPLVTYAGLKKKN